MTGIWKQKKSCKKKVTSITPLQTWTTDSTLNFYSSRFGALTHPPPADPAFLVCRLHLYRWLGRLWRLFAVWMGHIGINAWAASEWRNGWLYHALGSLSRGSCLKSITTGSLYSWFNGVYLHSLKPLKPYNRHWFQSDLSEYYMCN